MRSCTSRSSSARACRFGTFRSSLQGRRRSTSSLPYRLGDSRTVSERLVCSCRSDAAGSRRSCPVADRSGTGRAHRAAGRAWHLLRRDRRCTRALPSTILPVDVRTSGLAFLGSAMGLAQFAASVVFGALVLEGPDRRRRGVRRRARRLAVPGLRPSAARYGAARPALPRVRHTRRDRKSQALGHHFVSTRGRGRPGPTTRGSCRVAHPNIRH